MKKVLFTVLICLFLAGCDSAADHRQLSESIVRLQNDVDLAHEWLRDLREENRKLRWRLRIGEITREWQNEQLIEQEPVISRPFELTIQLSQQPTTEQLIDAALVLCKPSEQERQSITRMLDEAIDKCKSSKRPDRLDMSTEQMIDAAIDGCRASNPEKIDNRRPNGHER